VRAAGIVLQYDEHFVMGDKLRIRVTRRCYVGAVVVEAGEVVAVDARAAIDLVGSGRAEALDPVAYRQACAAVTERSMRIAGPAPRGPRALPWARTG
jgi:hypothetical protein